MNEMIPYQRNLTRRLRQLSVLLIILLMPIGAWAQDDYSEDYSIIITIDSKDESVWIVDTNADNILGDGTISYDATNNVLTLNNINLACTKTDATFISCVDYSQALNTLTVHLVGSNTITLGNNAGFFYGSALTFTTDDNYPGSLTITKEDGWSGKLFENSANGDPTITPTFNNHLYLDHDGESECLIQWLTPPGLFSYNNGNNIVFRFGYETGNDDEVIHYSIDYVDESLQDVTDTVYDVNGDDQPLLGPCTMTYYITAGGGQSETKTAKLFGLATNSVTTTLGTPVAPPTILPAFDHSEDLIITETQTPATGVAPDYDGTIGLISTSAVGETTCSVKLSYYSASWYDYLVLNEMDDNQKYQFGSFTLTVNEAVSYNLRIGDTQVTSANASDIFGNSPQGEVNGEGLARFAITTDPTTNEEVYTLTLENATIDDYQEWSVFFSYPKLTVHLIGENHIVNGFTYYGQTPATGTIEFTSDGGEENCLIFDSAESVDDLSNPDYYVGFSHCTYNDISDATGWTFGTDANNHVKLYKQVSTPYDLWIGEWQVTSTNAGNLHEVATNRITVGEGGSVTFDATSSTLTLVNATINDQIESSLSSLTIQISGTNTISAGANACIRSTDETAPLIFTTSGTAEPTLTLTNDTQSPDIPSVIVGFASLSNVYLSWGDNVSGYHVSYDGTKRLVTNYAVSTDNSHNVTLSPILEVAGTSVTSANAADVFGDGTVSFAPADAANNTVNTLTLNNANLTGGILWYSDDEDLTISIMGNNSIDITQSNSAVVCIGRSGSGDARTLNFERGDANNACVLNLTCDPGVSYLTTGFTTEPSAGMPSDGMYWIPITDSEGEIYSTIITSSPFSGGDGESESTAFKISTPQDLKNLSALYNTGALYRKFYQLTTDIDCDNLTGFVPIADTGSQSTGGIFEGSFDGKGFKISNLTVTVSSANSGYSGLFGYIGYPDGGSSGTIVKNLTLENCTIGNTDYCGAIAGHIEGGTISGCTVTGCTISGTKEVGGIVGKCDDSNVTVSGCKVTGTTTVSCVGVDIAYAGALIGNYSQGTLSNNTYEYTATTSTKIDNDEAEVKKEYATRGTGVADQNGCYDILTDNGAILYTRKVTITGDHFAMEGDDGYVPLLDYQNNIYYFAPGQESTVSLFPDADYTISSVTLTYTLAGSANATVETLSNTATNNGEYEYTYTMPDADATLEVTNVPDAPRMYGEPINGADGVTLFLASEAGTIKYSIDYADANETDITDATYDRDNKPTISKPATVTAYLSVDGNNSATTTGKYFASDPNPFRLVYGADAVDLVLAPVIEEEDGISIESIEGNVNYNASAVKVAASATLGSIVCHVTMNGTNGKTEILNSIDNFNLNFEVVPPAPTIELAAGSYLSSHDPIQITGTKLDNVKIMYKWDDGDATEYTGPIVVADGTLAAWEEYTDEGNNVFASDTTTVEYTVITDIATLYFEPIAEVSYTGSAVTPVIVVKPTETAAISLTAGTDYTVSYKQGETAIAAADLINIGSYTALITGTGNYGGAKELSFSIVKGVATITAEDQTTEFTGSPIEFNKDNVTITPSTISKDGIGFSYTEPNPDDPNNPRVLNGAPTNVGTYTVYIYLEDNNYEADEVTKTLTITKATPTITFAQESYSATYGEAFASPGTVDDWPVTLTSSSNTSVANISEGQIVLVGVGTTTITVTYAGNDNYNSTTASYQLVVSRPLDITFAASQTWATYYSTENLTVPEGLTAYVVSNVNDQSGEVTVQTIDYMPEEQAVLLERSSGAPTSGFVAAPYTGTTTTVNNMLQGSENAVHVGTDTGDVVYVLYNNVFKRATSGTIPARRGYLEISAAYARLYIVRGDEETAIETIAASDGEDSWFTIDGRKLQRRPTKAGFYIKNGEKVFVSK